MSKKLIGIIAASLLVTGLAGCNRDNKKATADGAESIDTIGEQVKYKITGIEPGSGHMHATERVLEEYDLAEWEVTTGNGAAMTAALKKSYDKKEPIIVTGWSPHWKFVRYDLKFLDDPKLVYGGTEEIHTIGRIGLNEDFPEAYEIFQRFKWDVKDMEEIMVEIEEGTEPEEAAQHWIDKHKAKVDKWTEGVRKVKGVQIKIASTVWDSEIASHHMMKLVLEDMGYDVKLMFVELGPLFAAIADGSTDVSFAPWLPNSHKPYVEKFEGKFDDIGVNMENVRQGLVVPSYMDIDSIEDLK
ncbi:glycine/betaine ABC transporter [Cytobacillus depressus]|uniref:Glycine/betaine ABC transporter n=1 Tax=Cytobacillus depressus TaxID=1602942 RepID=A0A6L3VAZ7_9BACI|nr:glycine betaine ABC transporter substrate-binding protein [Cytobacillus depressus]KAB2337699.1 glycine/betaine ABC transporter [Cytobacillus depressus]